MARGKGTKRVLLAGALLMGALFLLWLSAPLWFPWILRPLASKRGATYGAYERLGYNRFAVYGLVFTNGMIELKAKRAEALTPTVWLVRALRHKQREPFLRVDQWQLRISDSKSRKNSEPTSPVRTVQQLRPAVDTLRRWLPNVALSNGTVELDQQQIVLPELRWEQGKLDAGLKLPRQHQQARITANLASSSHVYYLDLVSDSLHLNSTAEVRSDADHLTVSLTNLWQGNKIELEARFGSKGLLPEMATVRATNFVIPGSVVQLRGYKELRGTVTADWNGRRFETRLSAQAEPNAAETNWPPARIHLEANGDTNTITVTAGTITSPAVNLTLANPAELHLNGPLLREPAQLKLAADFSSQPWIPARGQLEGQAELLPTKETYPRVQFGLTGANVSYRNLVARQLSIQGGFQSPVIELTRADINFDDGSQAKLAGKFDLSSNAVDAGEIEASGPLANRWLPAGYSYQDATVSVSAAGSLTNLAYQALVTISNFASAELRPANLQAKWNGQNFDITEFQLGIRSGASSLEASAAARFDLNSNNRRKLNLEIKQLTLTQQGVNQLALQSPAKFSWLEGQQISVEDLHLAGSGGEAQLAASVVWPRQGSFHVSLHNLASDLVAGFMTKPPPPSKVRALEAAGGWSNGPISFQAKLDAEAAVLSALNKTQSNSTPLTLLEKSALQADLRGDAQGISISNVIASASTGTVAVARGFVPISINPVQEPMIQVATNGPIELSLRTGPGSVFWTQLANWTGLALDQPEFSIDAKGTLEQPLGQAHLRARKIELRKSKSKLPVMEDLKVDLVMDSREARLETAQVLVERQPVKLTGRLPLGPGFWEALAHKRGPNWDKAEARLRIDHAAIAAFADLFPALLAPQGHFDVDAEMIPGGAFRGNLSIERARTRPLPSVGAIRDIGLKLTFAQRELQLAEGHANIGGATIAMGGKADLRGSEWLEGIPPPFQFSLRGTNVPLAREPESIVRADLDLRVVKTNQNAAVISGEARVHDSYYLSDLSDLVPGKAASPKKRPPYFSIDVDPLAAWGLAVNVKGEKGFRVRSTLFNGQISLNLKLTGTLEEPIALGEAKIDMGTVRFPFGSLEVQQGFVTLTSQNPYEPQLLVAAASKQFGYDVRMDMTGPAEAPVIKFSSTPPLSSEQLVLMLTAGELPRGEFNLTPQQKAQTVALFLGKDLLAKLGFGDQSEQRLSFSSGQEITEQGKPTYSIEYKLTDRWSLVGEYDRFNAYNAGLKWRVYSK
jgi:translocation and assembly module TamB